MTIGERVQRLKGLMEGMKLDTESDQGKLLALMADILEDEYPEGMDETTVNDIFWFEDDFIAECLGYDSYDQLWDERHSKIESRRRNKASMYSKDYLKKESSMNRTGETRKGKLNNNQLFNAIRKATTEDELDHHESDLYCKITPQTREIAKQWKFADQVETFRDQITGEMWFCFPFAYVPYWKERGF